MWSIDSYWHENVGERFDRRAPAREHGTGTSTLHFLAYLNFEREVFLQVLDDHHEKGQLDPKGLLRIGWTGDVCRTDVGADDFQDERLNFIICDPFDVPVANLDDDDDLDRSDGETRRAYLLVPDL